MSHAIAALTLLAALISAATWFSLRMAAAADLNVLPASSRKRLDWWRSNAPNVYLICAGIAVANAVLHL